MHLSRVTPNWNEESFLGTISDDYKTVKSTFPEDFGAWIVVAHFPRFGGWGTPPIGF